MQLDLKYLHAKSVVADLIKVLSNSEDKEVNLATKILEEWNCEATKDSIGACIFYPFFFILFSF